MEEPYVKDLASHGGPESCVGDPRGRSEALTGVHAGRVSSLENSNVQGADAVVGAEGNTASGVIASRWRALRGRRTRARKAPDNRHEERNERVLHRRSSKSRWPRVMRWRPARAQRSVDRGARGPAIQPRNGSCPGCRRAHARRKATPPVAFLRVAGGPRGVEEPEHVCDLFMLRTGRSHGCPVLLMAGRAAQGRLRSYA
jgi:hypothetical protein